MAILRQIVDSFIFHFSFFAFRFALILVFSFFLLTSVRATSEELNAEAGADIVVDEGQPVYFDGSKSKYKDGDVTFIWDFDKYDSTEIKPTHTYTRPGTYLVTLIVIDSQGNKSEDALTVVVRDKTKPVAKAVGDTVVREDTAGNYSAANSTDNGEIAGYLWDFGDGTKSTDMTPRHIFVDPGTYTITLSVTDKSGNIGTTNLKVTVLDATPPIAKAGTDKVVSQKAPVAFDGTQSADNVKVVSYYWDFGFGGTASGPMPVHKFNDAGVYLVALTVKDAAGNTNSDTLVVTVKDTTNPIAKAGENKTVDEDVPVDFSGEGSSDNVAVTNYIWDFGDGSEQKMGIRVSHTYPNPSKYTVTLRVMDTEQNMSVDTIVVTIRDKTPPQVDAGSDKTAAEHTPIVFDGANTKDNGKILSYAWEFGDGKTKEGVIVEYTYPNPGNYRATLSVTDAAGNKGFDTLNVVVLDKTPPRVPSNILPIASLDEITLKWDKNSESDFAYYNVYRSTKPDSEYSLAALKIQNAFYEDRKITKNMVYYYTLSAVDANGNESDVSKTVSASLRNKIVFSSNRTGNYDLYVMNADGSGIRNITNSPSLDEWDPSFAPNGTKIVFVSIPRDINLQCQEIHLINSDGTSETNLTKNCSDTSEFFPAFSPDGKKIVFSNSSKTSEDVDVFLMNADGSGKKQLTRHSKLNHEPSFSPDGSKIVFQSNRFGNPEIFLMNPDGTNVLKLTSASGTGVADDDPNFSPDGDNIVFHSNREDSSDPYGSNTYQVYLINADGANLRRLTNGPAGGKNASFSSDGKKIIFERKDSSLLRTEIGIMNVDGTNLLVNLSSKSLTSRDVNPSF